ncbi:MAG: DUF1292 domain-containing protein [Christensenellales bacterium]|jgi:uncharacterized protein YrzB (UPF0473 family)
MDDKTKPIPEDEEIAIIALTGDDGNEIQCEHFLTLSYDDELYAAVHPLDDKEEGSVYFMKLIKASDKKDILEVVDNEILSQELFNEFMQLLDEMEENRGEE